jgi:uncharacterized membrane protein
MLSKREFNPQMSMVRKVSISGLVMALYITVMYFTWSISFMTYQIRFATALYALSATAPFLIVPLSLSNLLSNALFGGLGIPDIVGGFIVGLITSSAIYLIKRLKLNDWFMVLPIVFGPGLIVPIWLSRIIGVPYNVLALSICIGQTVPALLGVMLVKRLNNIRM